MSSTQNAKVHDEGVFAPEEVELAEIVAEYHQFDGVVKVLLECGLLVVEG